MKKGQHCSQLPLRVEISAMERGDFGWTSGKNSWWSWWFGSGTGCRRRWHIFSPQWPSSFREAQQTLARDVPGGFPINCYRRLDDLIVPFQLYDPENPSLDLIHSSSIPSELFSLLQRQFLNPECDCQSPTDNYYVWGDIEILPVPFDQATGVNSLTEAWLFHLWVLFSSCG